MFLNKQSRILRTLATLCLGLAVAGGSAFAAGNKIYNVIFVPKAMGIPWFSSMEKGLNDYASQAGGLNFTVLAAPDTDPAAQARILQDAIAKKPDAIIVVPNDTKVLEPIMKQGMSKGIKMISQEAPSVVNAVADIEFLILEKEGKDLLDLLVKNGGPKGGYAIMVGGLTVESHNKRADSMVAQQEKLYPDLHQVTSRLEGSENVQTAHDKTLELLTAYPDLVGIVYIGSLGAIGGAQAIAEKNLQGKIGIVGESLPSQAKKYLADKSMSADYIGNPYRIGKDTAYITKFILNGGKLANIGKLPEYGQNTVNGKIITFHADTEVTAENADSFGF
jgi:simple sugar transport system substrate-binding protein